MQVLTQQDGLHLAENGLHHRGGGAAPSAAPLHTSSSQVPLRTGSGATAGGDSGSSGSDVKDSPGGSNAAGEGGGEGDDPEFVVLPATYREIAKYFGILGWTAFGGPAAHIGA